MLRNENSIIPETKSDRFLKPVKFGLKVSEVIKASFLTYINLGYYFNLLKTNETCISISKNTLVNFMKQV